MKILNGFKKFILMFLALAGILIDRCILFFAIWKEIPSIQDYNEFEVLITDMVTRVSIFTIIVLSIVAIWSNIHYLDIYSKLL